MSLELTRLRKAWKEICGNMTAALGKRMMKNVPVHVFFCISQMFYRDWILPSSSEKDHIPETTIFIKSQKDGIHFKSQMNYC